MAWSTEMVTILRHIIDDASSPYTYSDTKLQQVIVSCAQLIKTEITAFASIYTTSIDDLTISPDPTSLRDESFINLVLLKCACFIAKGEIRKAVKGSFMMEEFKSKIDTKGRGKDQIELAKTWCQDYEEAVISYLCGDGSPGMAVLGPFRDMYKSNGNFYIGG